MINAPLTDQIIDDVSRIFGSLGDPSRLKILRTLLDAERPLSQGALIEATGLSQANASKHLSHLVQAGLVLREPAGNMAFFRPVMPIVPDVCGLVCQHVKERIQAAYESLN